MPRPVQHPDELELREFASGSLAEPDLERLAEHLGQCVTCREKVDEIADRDLFLGRLQEASALSEELPANPGERQAAIRALGRIVKRWSGSGTAVGHDPGEILREVGPYTIVREVGRGGMGVVYLARHGELDRSVAIKMILSGEFASDVQRQRFRREAELAARVHHPNIVQVYEVALYQGRPYLALEWCDGGSLADRIKTEDWPPRQAAELVATLAEAIETAHRRGVIHRDLKPSNILLQSSSDPRQSVVKGGLIPKIADFGLALGLERESGLTSTGQALGTPQYMAPEQARGEPAGTAADTYALGAILYELLTGWPPVRGGTVMEIVHALINEHPVAPRRLRPSVPRDLETIVLKALESEPSKRYATAGAMAHDLRSMLASRPIQAKPARALERLLKWTRRRPGLAAVSGLLLAVLLSAFVAITTLWFEAARARDNATMAGALARRQNEVERRIRYSAGISAAASALELDHGDEARTLLENLPEEHRDWEWRYLAGQLDNCTTVLRPEEGPITAFDLAPDGNSLVYAVAGFPELRLRDMALARDLARFEIGHPEITAAAFSPDGQRIAAGLADGTIGVWHTRGGHPIASIKGEGSAVRMIVFDHATPRLVYVRDPSEATLWNPANGQRFPLGRAWDAHFSPDGQTIVCKGESEVRFLNAADGRGISPRTAVPGPIRAATFSPDGSRIATGGNFPATDIEIDPFTAEGPKIALRGHDNTIISVDFSPDGRRLASGSLDQTARIWDARTGSSLAVLPGHRAKLAAVQFASGGRRLVTRAEDDAIRLWETSDGALLRSLRGHAGVSSIRLSRNGDVVAINDRHGALRIWNLDRTVRRGSLDGHTSFVYDVAISGDGRWLASGSWDKTVRFWDQNAGGESTRSPLLGGFVMAVAAAPSGTRFATVEHLGRLCLWEPPATEPLWRTTFDAGPNSENDGRVSFHPSQGILALAGDRAWSARFFDAATGASLGGLPPHDRITSDVAFSPDGTTIATGDLGGKLQIWDFASRSPRQAINAHESAISRVAFHPGGALLASAGLDGLVTIWKAESGRPVATLKHAGPVYGIAFNPDGTRIATACADDTIRLWDTTHFEQVAEVRGHRAYVHAVIFSADGTRLISGSGDRTVRIWDAPQPARAKRWQARTSTPEKR